MIKLTRLNDSQLYVNPHQIEFMESTPDTIIKMLSDRKIIVKESCEDIIKMIIAYRKQIGIIGNDTTV
ncbi:MAG: flagellar FlbD family protein [Spirochaetota bacterium]|nr:flagellar FlbD family protein [Spirochaetota bacterium]